MIAAKFLTTALFLTIATLTSSASATVVDFNKLAGTNVPGNTYVYTADTLFSSGASFTTNGFKFTSTSSDYLIGTKYSNSDTSTIAYNGTDYFMAQDGFSVTSATAAAFSLNSIDLVSWTTLVTTATLTGTKVGGQVVTKTITLDTHSNSSKLTGNDFLTYALTGFDGLTSLSITHSGSSFLAVDNVVLDAATVPEPSSVALFGLALAAGALVRRRRA
jgi:hypothetical protein